MDWQDALSLSRVSAMRVYEVLLQLIKATEFFRATCQPFELALLHILSRLLRHSGNHRFLDSL